MFVNYISVDFKNIEREVNQNAGRNFRQKEVKLFGMEYTMDAQKIIWNNRTLDNYKGIELHKTKEGVMESLKNNGEFNFYKSLDSTSMLKFWHCIQLYMLFGQDSL